MRPALGDDALVEDDDLVGLHHGRQAMGDDKGGPAGGDAFERAWISISV